MAKTSKTPKTTKSSKSTKSAKPASGGETPAGVPAVNTEQAAQSAAALLAARVKLNAATLKPESAEFKKLKAGLGKPAIPATSSVLSSIGGTKPAHGGFQQQVGHNQTIGNNVNRTGVPRRTSGG
jgi:hypothetical protein